MSDPRSPATPTPAVGAVVFDGDRVLLIERGRAPGAGRYTIPGGRIEPGESMRDAVAREVLEETGLRVRATELVYAVDAIDPRGRWHYVIVDWLCELVGPAAPRAGDDAAQALFVDRADLDDYDLIGETRAAIDAGWRRYTDAPD